MLCVWGEWPIITNEHVHNPKSQLQIKTLGNELNHIYSRGVGGGALFEVKL